ncbi:Flagellar biosynthesis protein FlhF [hydrothermal vent metagenome]|uniref:Flagellar biosynthesis protein FlhF n=1 Tax=hydrothermal vent metagenome TaxID=652676 RepID=A0A3B0X549_9ZZZZ
MQVKRFVAKDMRTVMRLVKEEIGADAVILSNRVVNGKVEILAARDFDETLINDALDKSLLETKPGSAAAYYERAAAERELEEASNPTNNEAINETTNKAIISSEKSFNIDLTVENSNDTVKLSSESFSELSKTSENNNSESNVLASPIKTLAEFSTQNFSDTAPDKLSQEGVNNFSDNIEHQAAGLVQVSQQVEPHISEPLNDSMLEMRDELKSLRVMIENQQVLGEWGDMVSKHPLRISLYKRLNALGLNQTLCKHLADKLDDLKNVEQAIQVALKQLVHEIPIANDEILTHGGVFAMVGPTGVGKTTTIAKLAARFVIQHGQRSVALISTDTYRIGAHEQLMTYGRLLSVPVHVANDTNTLQQLLHNLHDKKLILIDTAGMSQRDINISEQFSHLSHPLMAIKSYLVLSANAQESTLDEVLSVFKKANPAACILTKLDEAGSLGGVISAVVKHQLPIAYVSHGQKVPEDIEFAGARNLVDEALQYAKNYKQKIDEDFMALTFTNQPNHVPLS